MPPAPAEPKIYHIVHIDRLASVIQDGCLWCDATMVSWASTGTPIGMGGIKERRLSLPVTCHPGDHVGDYVPFYFCPRSIMLYVIHRGNNPELAYRGGQEPIVHLEAHLREVVAWADANGRRWAFSLSNAGAFYAQFHASLDQLDEINWPAVAETDFRSSDIKEGKQAEFLLYASFPWELIRRIGVISAEMKARAEEILAHAAHRPPVEIHANWYY